MQYRLAAQTPAMKTNEDVDVYRSANLIVLYGTPAFFGIVLLLCYLLGAWQ